MKADRTNLIADYEACLPYFERAVELKPQFHEALNNLGTAQSNLAKLMDDGAALFHASFSNFEAALKIKSDSHAALNNWGNALCALAELTRDTALFPQSFAKFDAALELEPNMYEALNNWGYALFCLAKRTGDLTAFQESFVKYDAAVKVNPDRHEALANWIAALLYVWHITKDPKLLIDAAEKLDQYDTLVPRKPYNSACLAAIRGEEERCRTLLFKCKEYGTLPDAKHLMEDTDLEPMRDKPWFKALVEGR